MFDDLYNQQILELAGNIPRIGDLPDAHARATAISKLCGSKVSVALKMDGHRIVDFAHDVRACALGQASASVMARQVVGSTAQELQDVSATMRRMLKEGGAPPGGKWKALAILEPVRAYKARHASTLLTFDAVEDCLRQILGNKITSCPPPGVTAP